ncbi:sensor histidine kinase [Pseudomonas chlororaphis]|uniref:histidine kinase n=1 Tax=Pseudomonas chlororaphis TaxID=587753 RepID=A0A0D5XX81_9PSED|nr:sensor histidine kinase [Pseudomonas chlororaphis]
MSLRLRLSLTIGAAFVLIWALASAWMFSDLRNQMMFSLDQRLVASARMVAGLLEQLPALPSKGEGTHFSAEQLNIPGGMACQVSSLRGEILARSHNHPDEKLEAERMGFHDQMIDGVRWRSFTLARGDLRITTADRQVEREALNLSVLLAASVPVGVALLACLWLLWLGMGQGLAPLNRMRDALMRRSADSLEPLQIHPLPSELRPLLETQNQLFQRIGKTIERERRLTGDAAHELRSPLTAIKTHLQVARMTEGAARDQSLARAEEGADRLHRTLEQLLLLARVEGSLSFEDGVQCSAEQVAQTAIQDAASGARQRVRLHVDERVSAAPLEMPSVLAIAALRNLLDNALRHTPSDAPVDLNLETIGNRVRFQVRDHGSGIPEDDLQHLTQRFWRNGQSTGCGLGLAIVQAIVQRCGCVLRFDSRPDGLRVELIMPLQSA